MRNYSENQASVCFAPSARSVPSPGGTAAPPRAPAFQPGRPCETQPPSSPRCRWGAAGVPWEGSWRARRLQPPGRVQRSALLQVTPVQSVRGSVAAYPAWVRSRETFLPQCRVRAGPMQGQLRFGQALPPPPLWLPGLGAPTRRPPSSVSTTCPLSGPSGGPGRGAREAV